MSVTYVNLGTTCTSFGTDSSTTKPTEVPNIILVNKSTNAVLKATNFTDVSVPTGTSVTQLGSNVLQISDFQLTANYYAPLVFGATPRPGARVLYRSSSSLSDYAKYGTAVNDDWTNGKSVTLYDNRQYTIYLNDSSPLNNLLGTYLPTLSGGTVSTGSTFYLRKYTPIGTNPGAVSIPPIYITRNFVEKDVSTASVTVADVINETFKFITKDENGKKIFRIVRGDTSAEIPDLVVVYDGTKNPAYYVQYNSVNYYCLDTNTPTEDSTTSSVITLIKNNVNKFITLGTDINATSFVLKDYWTSGLTSTQMQGQMMFRWIDLTPTRTGGTEDIYHWGIYNTNSGQVTNYMNVYSTNGGTTYILGNTTTRPPLNEGWAFSKPDGSPASAAAALVYKKVNTEIGYMDSTDPPVFVTLTPAATIPSTANVYSCVKCTNTATDGTGMCLS